MAGRDGLSGNAGRSAVTVRRTFSRVAISPMLTVLSAASFAAYLYGSVPYAYIAARVLRKKNLAVEGTGNIGVTNAFKVAGPSVGIITIAGEISKAILPILAARCFFTDVPQAAYLLVFFSLVGTSFSVFLKGKGGKGTTAGLWSLLMLSPWSCLIMLATCAVFLNLAKWAPRIKRAPLLLLPAVMYLVEGDVLFTLFGIMTAVLFFLNHYRRKDDYRYYGIFQGGRDSADRKGPGAAGHT